jgi:hypothetical protein
MDFPDVTISATSISINAGKDALDPQGKKQLKQLRIQKKKMC